MSRIVKITFEYDDHLEQTASQADAEMYLKNMEHLTGHANIEHNNPFHIPDRKVNMVSLDLPTTEDVADNGTPEKTEQVQRKPRTKNA